MTAPAKRSARTINLAPLGRHSRYMLASYLRHIFMVAAALMLIALTIDLWPQIPLLATGSGHGSFGVAFSIVRLAGLRICDLLPPFIPFATFLGVVWSEVAFTASQERMLIWNSGRSPLQCLTPALMTGLLMGGLLLGWMPLCGRRRSMCRSPRSSAAKACGLTAAKAAATTGSRYRTDCCGPRSNMARR